MKDSYYFPHDYNARTDIKCFAMIKKHGWAYYGLYWALIEIMHQESGRIPKTPSMIESLSIVLNMEKEALLQVIEAMVKIHGLFKETKRHYYSDRVLQNINERKLRSNIFSKAGRSGGIKSGIARNEMKKRSLASSLEAKKERKKERKKEIKERNASRSVASIIEEIKNLKTVLKWDDTRIRENLKARGLSAIQITRVLRKADYA